MAESITRKNIDLDILDYYDGKIKNYVDDKVGTGSLTIDDTLSDTSTNPVQNKVVKQALDLKADKTTATTDTDGLMSAEDKGKLDAFEITTDGGKLHDKDIATTDLIPTELPANGGNADTVNGLHASDFMPYIGVVDDLFAVNKTCICAYGIDTLNTPLKAGLTESGGGLCFVNFTNGAEWASYIVMPSGDEHLYSTTSTNGVLSSEWLRINDRNADTVGGFKIKVTHIAGSTNQYGNLLLWTVVDNKKPFLVIINGHYAIPFPVADSNDFYFYAAVIDYTNHSSVPNTSISADVYYLE